MTSATRPRVDVAVLADGVRRGEWASVARMLSVVEGGGDRARAAVSALGPIAGNAYTVGVTGAPGAGKSSLTDRLIGLVRSHDDQVAVLAVDPSSPMTGGAILGDRVRMSEHAMDPGVFIRSMATRGQLGGLSAATPAAIRVLDASGVPWIVVETVGVGQVELDVAAATDTTVVVVNPGWGDGVQANKAGLLEVADVFVVNKADRAGADMVVRDLVTMLELGATAPWTPPIVETVATSGRGVDELWAAIGAHREHLIGTGLLEQRRRERAHEEIRELVTAHFLQAAAAVCSGPAFDRIVAEQARGTFDPQRIADLLVADAITRRESSDG